MTLFHRVQEILFIYNLRLHNTRHTHTTRTHTTRHVHVYLFLNRITHDFYTIRHTTRTHDDHTTRTRTLVSISFRTIPTRTHTQIEYCVCEMKQGAPPPRAGQQPLKSMTHTTRPIGCAHTKYSFCKLEDDTTRHVNVEISIEYL